MQNDTADKLYSEVLRMQNAIGRLPHHCIGFWQQIVQRLPIRESLLEFIRLGCQFAVAQLLHILIITLNLLYDRFDSLDLLGTGVPKELLQQTHVFTSYFLSILCAFRAIYPE